MIEPRFRRATGSNAGDNCVEVATAPGAAFVRDSKDRSGPVLAVSAADWSAFVTDIKSGRI
ncbi:DUF397 domain-containing protein [Longispora fulva]|uniref:DUF397 domain-containing protein n=1 Tax=Longispora fulva TaxID=619741 RepID=UPI001E31AAC2|nr:DUF397 domain-containing protein [Longispora fulva]